MSLPLQIAQQASDEISTVSPLMYGVAFIAIIPLLAYIQAFLDQRRIT